MSSFLNASQIETLTGTFARHFEQYSSGIGNYVTVYKEPIKVFNNVNSVNVYGYDSQDNNANTEITYTEVSKTFPAMILNGKDIKGEQSLQLKLGFTLSDLFIKVDEENRNYLMNGKNERAIINGLTYDIGADYGTQNYFGLKYYYFKCEEKQ